MEQFSPSLPGQWWIEDFWGEGGGGGGGGGGVWGVGMKSIRQF